MFFYILFVAILNLALGYALAWYLHGLDTASGWSWRELLNRSQGSESALTNQAAPAPAAAASLAAESPPSDISLRTNPAEFLPAAALSPPEAAIVAMPFVERSLADAARELAAGVPESGSAPVEVAKPLAENSAADEAEPQLDAHLIEQAVADLRAELSQYRTEISAIDAELRDCASSPDETALRSCVDKFRDANGQYLEHRDSRLERLEAGSGQEAAQLTHELVQAVDRQDALVAATQANLDGLDLETNLAAQCIQLLSETQQISACSSQLDTALDTTLAEIIRSQAASVPAVSPDRPHIHDQLQQLFEKFWPGDSAAAPRLGIGLINPDELARLNAQFGMAVVDRALNELHRVVAATLSGNQQTAPTADRGCLLLLPGLTAREALAVVDRCRQQMDVTWFEHNGARFRVTISCAVTEAVVADGAADAADRLETMLHEAKRYGRNRTFIQDGPHPAPAVLPSLGLEQRAIIV